MIGFAGFCTSFDPSPGATDLLARLHRALPPPGPGAGPAPMMFAGERAGLAAAQWVRSDDGQRAVAFDGVIYNRAALRAGLTPSPPDNDAALVLALHARHGAACAERLRGPFAFAVLEERPDGQGCACLLARDPLGLRTLYYYHDESVRRLLFATGVRPLAASGVVPRQLDARGLYGFFRHGAVPEPFSMMAGVHALETGEWLFWQAGEVTRDRFRAPPRFVKSNGNDAQKDAKALRAALLDSVAVHLADDEPAGVFVGGGIGSAALLALARETGREKNLRALTITFGDDPSTETELARRTAEHFGVPHTPLRLDREHARAWFDDFLPSLDQPGVHGFPWFALCRAARGEGIGMALAGLGAGEFFGRRLRFPSRLTMLLRTSQRLGRTRVALGRLLGATASRPSGQRLADFFTRPPTPAGAYAALRGIHTAEEARAMVARFADPTGCADPAPDDAAVEFPTLDDEINALEFRRRLRDQRLHDANMAARTHHIELRLPFVDGRVLETLASMPAPVRLRGEHWCPLREAVPEIPEWVASETEGSLRIPSEAWRTGEWGAAKPADAAGLRTRRVWEQKWSLFLFRRWWRQVGSG